MRILTRYILADLLGIFLLSLVGMTALIFVVLVGKEAVEKGLGLEPLLQLLPYMVPQAMQFAIPGTMLLATTSVYGRMSAANEVVAIKSLGISPWSIAWPTLALATIVSLTAVYVNDLAVSWGRLGAQRVVTNYIEQIVYGRLRTTSEYSQGQFKINVRGVDGHRLIEPRLQWPGLKGGMISAEEAEIHADPAEGNLVIQATDFVSEGNLNVFHPKHFTHTISLDELFNTSRDKRSPSNHALAEIDRAKESHYQQVQDLDQELAAGAAFALLTGEYESLSKSAWQPRIDERRGLEGTLHRLHTEPYRRWANGFSCFCFVLVGMPLAILRQKGEFLASFFMCFTPILLVYYPLLMFSVDRAKDGALPPATVWLGNTVLALWGMWMMRRVVRH